MYEYYVRFAYTYTHFEGDERYEQRTQNTQYVRVELVECGAMLCCV